MYFINQFTVYGGGDHRKAQCHSQATFSILILIPFIHDLNDYENYKSINKISIKLMI